MAKLKTFFRRVRTMSLKRMVHCAKQARTQKRKPLLWILIDMVWCSFRYGVGYLDYLSFGFVTQPAAKRKTYMTMNDNLALIRHLNNKEKTQLFEDKCAFLQLFSAFVGRESLDLRACTAESFAAFCTRHPVFFAKEPDNYGGLGVRRIALDPDRDIPALQAQLCTDGQFCIEEAIVQHAEMARLNASSVNSVRIVTVLCGETIHVMYAILRVGSGGSAVDNISSGGMYAPLDETGVVTAPAFCDRTADYYEVHPTSGARLAGFSIPLFAQAVEMIRRAALVVPEVRYTGWDVAITKDGPVIIEGNTRPAYDMCQNYRHLGADKTGIKPRFQAILGADCPVDWS